MVPPVWVLDTNVVVSGFLSAAGPPGRLLDAALGGQLMLALDDRIEAEYAAVLARPKLGFRAEEIAAFVAELRFHHRPSPVPILALRLPDPADQAFLEVAMAAAERVLVTGNTKHFPASRVRPARVFTPAAAWRRLCELASGDD
jgi:putative PIN family toxin of toxin-antitoxin system